MVAEADAVDAAEDGLYGDRRGDELPPELADAGSRKARLAACREKLAAKAAETAARQQEKIDARAAEEQATGKGKRGRKLKPADDSVDPDAVANAPKRDHEDTPGLGSGVQRPGGGDGGPDHRRCRADHPGQ